MKYNLELEKAVAEIKLQKAKTVLLQLPSGLKPEAQEIQKKLESETDARVLIWLPGTFGACDIATQSKADLIITWGHTRYRK